jgi:hypothetical protein
MGFPICAQLADELVVDFALPGELEVGPSMRLGPGFEGHELGLVGGASWATD